MTDGEGMKRALPHNVSLISPGEHLPCSPLKIQPVHRCDEPEELAGVYYEQCITSVKAWGCSVLVRLGATASNQTGGECVRRLELKL